MVLVAVAGGTGPVALEVIDALLAKDEHQVLVLTRNTPPSNFPTHIKWRMVDYHHQDGLVEALDGVHTVLSFIQVLSDVNQQAQKTLIDASIVAGVRRFAPSEYASAGTSNMPWYEAKSRVSRYLEDINANEKKIEYCLFQPGLFLDYLAFPHKTAKYVNPLHTLFDFEKRRAIIVDGHEDALMSLTTASDFAAIVAKAVSHEGQWPRIGGMGNKTTLSKIIDIGNGITGPAFTVDKVRLDDLEAGRLATTWRMSSTHRAIPDDQVLQMQETVSIGMLLSTVNGAWKGSDELNHLFPDFDFTTVEGFLRSVWSAKA